MTHDARFVLIQTDQAICVVMHPKLKVLTEWCGPVVDLNTFILIIFTYLVVV